MSSLVLLEHVNFKVPYATGERVIREFFIETLGCPECPPGRLKVVNPTQIQGHLPTGTDKQIHVNLGPLSQIHFELCTGNGRPYLDAQKLRGNITIEIDDIDMLRHRLEARNYAYEYKDHKSIVLVDPLHLTTWICVPQTKMASMVCIRPGGVGRVTRLLDVTFECQPDVGRDCANFYQAAFGAKISILEHTRYRIETETGQALVFQEFKEGPAPNAYDVSFQSALHVCVYLRDFSTRAKMLETEFWVNPDYVGPPINDHVITWEQALEKKQFRMKKIGTRLVLEHEVRALDHPLSPFPPASFL